MRRMRRMSLKQELGAWKMKTSANNAIITKKIRASTDPEEKAVWKKIQKSYKNILRVKL